ncbi:MAG: zinc ribbon domain-containing protein [Methanoregula sp.]|uniref:zinc ribbon domain-containing protein n=1 Tax=Methanoregula sp. TaxID=2052170 RepID=UPI003C176020
MKCPHCGMNIRDETTECGYCGGKITRRPEKAAAGAGKFTGSSTAQKGAQRPQKSSDDPETGEDEEEGGLSKILQPGEQVLIGSLNVTVKKFFFHAYLTNRRIFLIDTQEKKLKVTAKDVPRDTIAGSIVEFSESSDPVLVLSIKSGDDEIKTMKLVFVQGGMDRSAEIDEWIALLREEEPPKKIPRAPAPEREEPVDREDEEPAFAGPPEKPRQRQELHPAKKPLKDHERQPPVKRLLSLYKVPDEEPQQEPEPEPVAPPRRTQIRQVAEPVKRHVVTSSYIRETPPTRESGAPPVRKPEVQSVMKVAIKGAMNQAGQQSQQPVKKAVVESQKRSLPEGEPEAEFIPPRRPVVQETFEDKPVHDELADTPQFCHNCGKKLPHSANFCPGCGTKLNQSRTLPHSRTTPTQSTRKATRTDPPGHEHQPVPEDVDEDEIEEEKAIPTRPPIKKAPKGSEMTILHKFLRR